ncbi:MAG: hypothetical protein HY904_03810 [Deltaproteobacteria bacterium]|nr:hypothetical protein [Deltaproteobacteria bacterium]
MRSFFALSLLLAACQPPSAPPPARADAPVPDKSLMGGKPQAGAPTAGKTPFEDAIRISMAFDAAASAVVAKVHLEPGFHAYGAGETTGKPLMLEVTGNAWNVKEVQMPPAQKKDLGELGSSFVITGDAEVRAVLAAAGPARPPVEGRLHYQVCSEKACDRPRSIPFKLNP